MAGPVFGGYSGVGVPPDAAPYDPVAAAGKVADEIDSVSNIVSKRFPIYDIRVGHNALVFRCRINETTLDDDFLKIKDELFAAGYIPFLTTDDGEYILLVTRKPQARYRSVAINMVFLLLTVVTTVLAGAWAYAMFDGKITIRQEDLGRTLGYFVDPHYLLLGGVFFALPLMLILGIHEFGHYFMARRHGVAASLPFFIPLPPYPFSPLGTMGAFISVREPIPNKKALLDIGIAGPIAGFVIALPVTILGLFLTVNAAHPMPNDVTEFFLPGDSALFWLMAQLFPGSGQYMLHPLAFAGWVGLLVTAINLLPAGQLDGGHIAHALFGTKARYFSYIAVGIMLVMGFFTPSWFIFAFMIILLGIRHPPPLNDLTRLDNRRKAVGAFAIVLLIICFVPAPLTVQDASYEFSIEAAPGQKLNQTVHVTGNVTNNTFVQVNFTFTIYNRGNTMENFTVLGQVPASTGGQLWASRFILPGYSGLHQDFKADVDVGQNKNYTLTVFVPNSETLANATYKVSVIAQEKNSERSRLLEFRIVVLNSTLFFTNPTFVNGPTAALYLNDLSYSTEYAKVACE